VGQGNAPQVIRRNAEGEYSAPPCLKNFGSTYDPGESGRGRKNLTEWDAKKGGCRNLTKSQKGTEAIWANQEFAGH